MHRGDLAHEDYSEMVDAVLAEGHHVVSGDGSGHGMGMGVGVGVVAAQAGGQAQRRRQMFCPSISFLSIGGHLPSPSPLLLRFLLL